MTTKQRHGYLVELSCKTKVQAKKLQKKIEKTVSTWSEIEDYGNVIHVQFGPNCMGDLFFGLHDSVSALAWSRRARKFCREWKKYKPELSQYVTVVDDYGVETTHEKVAI